MTENPRAARLAERIHVLVAQTLERGVKDPRLGFVTVTDVRVTGDLQHATIFYTVYGTEEERKGTAAALKSATGMIRSEIGRQLNTRLTPSIEFVLDALPENAGRIDDLLAQAREADERVAREREGKSFAGESDPYRNNEAETE